MELTLFRSLLGSLSRGGVKIERGPMQDDSRPPPSLLPPPLRAQIVWARCLVVGGCK